jgi:glycosyltransferase involved in cell wall biosynthesis
MALSSSQPPGKILFFSFTYPPANEIGSSRTHRFARYLPDYGYEVSVLACGEPTPEGVEPRAWTRPRAVRLWEKPIRRFLLPGEDGLSWISQAVGEACRQAASTRFDAILSSGPPNAPHLAAGLAAQRLGLPWVADFRDPVAGNPIRTYWGMRLFDRFSERWILERASAFVLCTSAMLEQVASRYPHRAKDMHLIWNGFDPRNVYRPPLPSPSARRSLVHLGSIYGERNPNLLLRAVDLLLSQGRLSPGQLHIRLIGGLDSGFEVQCPEVWSKLRERDMLSVDPVHQPKEVVRRELAIADGLLLLDLNSSNGYSLPAKIFEYIPAGRPLFVMTTSGAPSGWVLRQAGMPAVFLDFAADLEAAASAVLEFLALPAGPHEANEWFWSTFDGQRQVAGLAALFDALRASHLIKPSAAI